MKMELRHLRYFVAVARERSFSRAAEVLHIAQPPLSRQIQQLEEELGVPLIKRGTRPAHLTEQGRLLYEQAVQILERMEEIRAIVRRLERSKRNVFSVGFVPSTLYGRLPDVIRAYRAARPDTELNLVELTSLEQLSALKEGRIDIGFSRIPLEDPAIDRQLLRNEKLIVAFPLDHPISTRSGALRLKHLTNERLIVYPKAPRPSFADQVLSLFRDKGLKPAALHEVRELQTALGLVVAEAGICLVPASVELLRRDRIAYKALDEDAAVSPIFMSCRKDDASPEIALVLGLIRDLYAREGIEFGA
jgi:LysR family transcriptional regulator, benzoate and cis,cis-muconate-responsive activator of ben and cat genes